MSAHSHGRSLCRTLLAGGAAMALAFGLAAPAVASDGGTVADPQSQPQITRPPNPSKMGPYKVASDEYNDGDTAFVPPDLGGHAVEVLASVHYPKGLDDGPYPLIVLMHGRHSTCGLGSSARLQWPCSEGWTPIPSYKGYDYLAENLASWGYIVVSVSANGINAFDNGVSDLGAMARAELIQHHLDKWQEFSTDGGEPFGDRFVGKVDMQNVGEMGHSRGGEGVARSYLYNQDQGSPYGITAVLPLAPVDFNRPVIDNVPLDIIVGYCDGDVSDLQGVHFYDDARYSDPDDTTPKHTLEVMGANHNYFNTIWTPGGWPAGAGDDWGGGSDPVCGSQEGSLRLTATEQTEVGLAYMAAFFRLYVGGETDFMPYFDGSRTQPRSVKWANVYDAYHAGSDHRLTVNSFLDASALKKNDLGGKVKKKGLSPFDVCGGDAPEPLECIPEWANAQQPHTTPSARSSKRGLSQLRFGWTNKGSKMINKIPDGKGDAASYDAVTFRVSQNVADDRAPGGELKAKVVLKDASGNKASAKTQKWSDALFQQLGTTASYTPKIVMNSVRIPLSAFEGVDLGNISSVTIVFTSKKGAVLMTDLAFAT